jgi:hypothetical protein
MEADLCVGFAKSEWKSLNKRLDDGDESAWAQAIGVFESRMRERFLNCVSALFGADTKPPLHPESGYADNCVPGFSIMALCCLLIDTLQEFREKPPHPVQSGATEQQFKSFLRRPAFGDTFKDDALVRNFVKGIRNAILHEAETRKWVIWRDEPVGQIVAPEEDGFALNRTLFYEAVKNEFDSYVRELREPSNETLRRRFKEKMDDICEGT